jgi:HPt (histidine-containing phosphotransfer) domain-containing protein
MVPTSDDRRELWERFGARFLASTRERLERAREMVAAGLTDAHRYAREMHALAGEAAVMGVEDVKELAVQSSELARASDVAKLPSVDPKLVANCDDVVRRISSIIDSLEARRSLRP